MTRFKNRLWWLLLFCLLISCIDNKELNQKQSTNQYFSTKDYFESEARRLSEEKTSVLKLVKRNSGMEEKKMMIHDWKKEFNLFIESDINKVSWKDSYNIIIKKDTLLYQSKDPKLKTQQILLVKNKDGVTLVSIQNRVQNGLYKSEENLSYYPDSLYHITKIQEVLVLGKNRYEVSGRFQ